MHIQLPNGDKLIPRSEFAALIGATPRTVANYEHQGLPTVEIAGLRYNPHDEGLNWIANRIQRRNPRRTSRAA